MTKPNKKHIAAIDTAARAIANELTLEDTPEPNRRSQMALIRAAGLVRLEGKTIREALTEVWLEPLAQRIEQRAAEIERGL